MGLGPRPVGDPAGMLALAGQISAAKGTLGKLPEIRFDAWQSERAQQARAEIQSHISKVSGAEGQLGDAIALLKAEAEELKAKQDKWDKAKAAQDADPASKAVQAVTDAVDSSF